MRTNTLLLYIFLYILAVSCAKEIDDLSVLSVSINIFTAEKEEFPGQTKAVLNANKTIWQVGDEIAVYSGGDSPVKFTSIEEGSKAKFTTDQEVSGSSFLLAYPFGAARGIENGNLKLRIPKDQNATNGTFDPCAGLSAASVIDFSRSVKFKNVLALLKFNIPAWLDGSISEITVESRNGESIAGDIICNVSDRSNISDQRVSNSVSLKGTQMTQGYYYIAVRPGQYTSGIRVCAWSSDGKKVFVRESKACEFVANTIYDMGEIGSTNWTIAVVNEGKTVTSGLEWTIDWDFSLKPGRYDFYLEPFQGTYTFFWLLKSGREYRYHVVSDNKFDISTRPWSGDSPNQKLPIMIDPTVQNVISVEYRKHISPDGNEYISFDWILNGRVIHNNISDGIYNVKGTDSFLVPYSEAEGGARFQFKGDITISKWVYTSADIGVVDGDRYLMFKDEFDADGIPDPEKWSLCKKGGSDWNDEMSESYDQAYVKDGVLVLVGEKIDGIHKAGGIQTKDKFDFTFGRVECRARITHYPNGAFPAIWMMPQKSYYQGWPDCGEIDIMEHIKQEQYIHQVLHTHYTDNLGYNNGSAKIYCNFWDWTVYAVEWTSESITFYVNNVISFKYDNMHLSDEITKKQWPFTKDSAFYLILNMGLGDQGTWAGPVDDAKLPAVMEVDWVRVYGLKYQ